MTVKDCEKFTIVSHYDFKTVSIALMSYQEFSLYAQCMMNMILQFYKIFMYYYINNNIIFLNILQNYFQYLNIIFNLFDKLKIIFKKIKIHLK